jgi:endonuclease/exonuclease/phosphatase family metal-dependent hydrolase
MTTFRAMSFNVRGASAPDGVNRWSNRAALNVATIQRYKPDLIGFQELQQAHLNVYLESLSGYEHLLGLACSGEEHGTIFWKPACLTLLTRGGFWLNEISDAPGHGWDAACVRAANWAEFQVVGSKQKLLHVNTHLDHIGEQARQEGTRLILQKIQQIVAIDKDDSASIIITGDFNCNPGSPTYRLWREQYFVDTYLATGNVDDSSANTFHGYGAVNGASAEDGVMRIDWILLRNHREGGLRPVASEIVRDAQPPLYPSDHYPVWTDFAVNG